MACVRSCKTSTFMMCPAGLRLFSTVLLASFFTTACTGAAFPGKAFPEPRAIPPVSVLTLNLPSSGPRAARTSSTSPSPWQITDEKDDDAIDGRNVSDVQYAEQENAFLNAFFVFHKNTAKNTARF